MDLTGTIRSIPNFPQKGILFRDITTMLKDPIALKSCIDRLVAPYRERTIDQIVGIESRGFIFGIPMAYQLGVGFVPARKSGKLPAKTVSERYGLEYGTDSLEMHVDAIEQGQRVLIVDDLLATGGTARATCNLVEQLGGEVAGLVFVIELAGLKGRDKLAGYDIFSLIKYED